MKSFIRVATLNQLFSHTRYLITLRSSPDGVYHSLLLFRLSSGKNAEKDHTANQNSIPLPNYLLQIPTVSNMQIYVMESSCPHLGADLSHAEIEECGMDMVAVCPWHRYDFDLRTGKSETGLRACVYEVEFRPLSNPTKSADEIDVWVETPDSNGTWELVELRPVSEEFADPPASVSKSFTDKTDDIRNHSLQVEPVIPEIDPPSTLLQWAVIILNTSNAALKVERTRHAVNLFRTGKLKSIGRSSCPKPPDVPPRDDSMRLVDANKVGKRGKAGSLKSRIAMLHALANIEQWAIDLAWDILARFGSSQLDLPHAFFTDFTKVALDESKHFSLLVSRLSSLGCTYGELPIHSSLWSSASATAHSLRARLAIIHLVHEARGLDVNPATIEKFRKAGDDESVQVLTIIHLDEITHVTAGHRWFSYVCREQAVDPVETFREEVRMHFVGALKGPFNIEDRRKAGLGEEFYEDLVGTGEALSGMVSSSSGIEEKKAGPVIHAQIDVQYTT